jgi:hypothetical protein
MIVQDETPTELLAVWCCAWVALHFGQQPILPRSFFDTTGFDTALIRTYLLRSGTARIRWHGDFICCSRIF